MKRALYGTARAPRLWHDTLETFLRNLEFLRSVADACLYYRKSKLTTEIIFFHVDDLILCTVPDKAKEFIKAVKKKFDIHDMGFPNEILGIQVIRDKFGIRLSTKNNELKIIEEFELSDAMRMNTPLPPGLKLPSLDDVPNPVIIEKYRSLLGKLLYLARCVRYDICYAVNLLSRYSSNHNKSMWNLLKGILRYLKDNELQITYVYKKQPPQNLFQVNVFSDASFADNSTN